MGIVEKLLHKLIQPFRNGLWLELNSSILKHSNTLLLKKTTYRDIPVEFSLKIENGKLIIDGGFSNSEQSEVLDGGFSNSEQSEVLDGAIAYSICGILTERQIPKGVYRLVSDGCYFVYNNIKSKEVEYFGGILYIGPEETTECKIQILSSPDNFILKQKDLDFSNIKEPGSFKSIVQYVLNTNNTIKFEHYRLLPNIGNLHTKYNIRNYYLLDSNKLYTPFLKELHHFNIQSELFLTDTFVAIYGDKTFFVEIKSFCKGEFV